MKSPTSSPKKGILWNIIEPGDPFDIRKSLIAQLPGYKKIFMGEHLQIVCLLQAVQIERLCQYLQDYKLIARQVERKQLDRHSYQIQIKQLTEQMGQQNSYKRDNIKLMDFLKKQTAELDQLKKKIVPSTDQTIERKYKNSLVQIDQLLKELTITKDNYHKLTIQYENCNIQLSIKTKELEKLFESKTEISTFEKEKKQLTLKYQTRISMLQMENTRFKQITQQKNRQIQDLKSSIVKFQTYIEQIKNQNGSNIHQINFQNLQRTLKDYQARFSLLGSQVERLNLVLRDKSGQLNEIYIKYQDMQRIVRSKDTTINDLQVYIDKLSREMNISRGNNENKQTISIYQNKIQYLSRQIQRTNQLVKTKVEENTLLIKKINQYQYQFRNIDLIRKQNQDLKLQVRQISQYKRKISQYESKLSTYRVQLERFNNTVRGKTQEILIYESRNKSLQSQNENYRKRIIELQSNVSNQWKNKLLIYQQKMITFTKQNQELRRKFIEMSDLGHRQGQYQNKIAILTQQIQRLTQTIKAKNEEINNYQVTFRKQQIQLQGYKRNQNNNTYDMQTKITIYQQRINILNKQNQQYRVKIQQQLDNNRKLLQYQSQIIIFKQQIQKITTNIRLKTQQHHSFEVKMKNLQMQNQSLKKRIFDSQTIIYEQFKVKINKYQQTIINYQHQIEQYKKKNRDFGELSRKNIQYENRIAMLSQEIQRLTLNIKIKNQENNSLESRNRSIQLQLQNFRKRLSDVDSSLSHQWNSKIMIYQQRIGGLSKQIDEYRRLLKQYQVKYNISIQQIQRLNTNLKQKVDEVNNIQIKYRNSFQQIQILKKKITELTLTSNNKLIIYEQKLKQYEGVFNNISIENQRLSQNLKVKVQQNNHNEVKIRNLHQQLQSLRNRFVSMENSISYQWKSKITVYQQKINAFNIENQQLRRKIKQYQNKIVFISQQTEKVNHNIKIKIQEMNRQQTQIRSYTQQIQMLRQRINQLENILNSQRTRKNSQYQHLSVEWNNKTAQYQQIISNLNTQIQQLRIKNKEYIIANKKLIQFQNKILMITQQLQRVNQNLRIKVEECNSLQARNRTFQQQIEIGRRKINEYQSTISHEWNIKVTQYQQKILMISHQNQQMRKKIRQLMESTHRNLEYQNRINILSQDIQRINHTLKIKSDQLKNNEIKIRNLYQQLQSSQRKLQIVQTQNNAEWVNRMNIYEQNIILINRENQQLKRYKIQIQNKLNLTLQTLKMKQQQRINYQNRYKTIFQQLEINRSKIFEFESSISHQWRTKINAYEQKLLIFTQQNEQLKRKIKQVNQINRRIPQYQNRIVIISQQNERLNNNLKIKIQQLNSVDNKYKQIIQKMQTFTFQNQQLKKKIMDSNEMNRRILQYQSKISILNKQIQILNINYREQNNKSFNISGEIENLRRRQIQLNSQIQRLNFTLRSKNDQYLKLQTSFHEYKLRYQQYDSKSSQRQTQYQKLISSYTLITTEYQNSKKHLQEYQISIKKLYGQFERLQTIMQEIRKENYNLKTQLQKSENWDERNRMLSVQIDRLNQLTQRQKLQLQQVRIRLSDEVTIQKKFRNICL